MIDRSRALVTPIAIPQTRCAGAGICPRCTAAIHGGLRARAARNVAPPGYLAALRDGRLHVTRLDFIHLPLRISATRVYGEGANTVYEFVVSAATVLLAEGRVTIIERP
jgi:predicted hotdog family 3-hydroxylacyl-ACP dehydratase